MIDHLRHMAIFARVVDEGSFRGAAKSIGLAPSRISETVTDLENFLGVTLLYRTTRKIALTNEGRVFYGRAVEMIRSAETGLNELNTLSVEPVGALRVSVPAFMSSSALLTAMGKFARTHPHVALTLSFTDRPVDLIDDGFDLNIRVGWLDDSSMMSRKLGEIGRALVSGAGYAASRPKPKHPDELEDWDWISYAQRSDTIEFVSSNEKIARVAGKSQIQVDNVDALHHLTQQNLGITVLPHYLAERGLKLGNFVELLPDWKLRPLGIYAVWPDQSRRENLTVHFVRFLAATYQS
ncbi:LysR family transcriptional regulator [Ruegeria sp. 2205SS24-7]|uniref:LysR family transcriptional regulator n=1 Tax=Ruegeria discodermiae TaxID=3064389 RepID=UPI0027421A02|nr:LysR family transcriptional regulator [Ruegeria sp. 2205SS24-7]MDP5219815.1 LysR family transcriptional regulator [Ruegeria sp. 2205SS24-7]